MSNKLYKIRIQKGDTVIVNSGKYKGKTGKILSTNRNENTVIVEGINIVKKHQKPNKTYPQGGIIELTKPIDVSKVNIYEPISKKASRVGYKINEDGSKTRVFKLNGKEIK